MAAIDSVLALLNKSPQNYQSNVQQQTPIVDPTQQTQPQGQQAPSSWVSDLIQQHSNDGGRIKRTPVGFQFQSIPFDPSSYYNALGTMRDVSRLATNVTETEAQNRQQAALEAQQAQDAAAAKSSLNGVNPNFTYSGSSSGSGGNFAGVSRKYHLKGIAPDVGRAADELGSKFGIKTIYGLGAGSVPGSDHPKGLALDYMISNTSNGHGRGTSLANYITANAASLNIKYVIWNHYIWYPGGRGHTPGWHKYNGSNPHTDHVHVSFNS